VLAKIAAGGPLRDILEELIYAMEAQSQDMRASVMLVDASGQRLVHCAAPSLPKAFIDAIDGLEIGPGSGSCGASAFSGAAVFVADVATDPLCATYRDLGREFGLHACWSAPIKAVDGRVLGTIALYHRAPRQPSEQDRELIELVAQTAALAIERYQQEQEHEELLLQFRQNEARQSFLLKLGDRLKDLTEPRLIALAAAEAIGRKLGAARVGYGEIDPEGETVSVKQDWTDGSVASLSGESRILDGFGPDVVAELREGHTLVVDDCANDPRAGEPYAATWSSINARALVVVPLIKHGRLSAIFYVHSPLPRHWYPTEVTLAETVAARTWDAVERAHAEAALRESEDHYRHTVELNPQVAWTADPDGKLDHVAKRWLEWTGTDGLGSSAQDSVHPDDAQPSAEAWKRSVATGEPYDREHRIRLRDGSYRWMRSRAYPRRDASGAIIKWYGATEDVHERRSAEAALRELADTLEQRVVGALAEREEVEDALRQAQKMEAVGQLTGGIAHDFNNLLTGIIGSLELLDRRISMGRADNLERYSSTALSSARRAAALTQRLLAFARRQALNPKPLSLNTLVTSMEDLIRRTVGAGIEVEAALEEGLWTAHCDVNQLENALLNLCINARDAMPNGGRITIETANVELDESDAAPERGLSPGQYVLLCVADTGAGMTPDVMTKVFEPFFTTKPAGEGTGLGLSQLHGFIKQSGGHVGIASWPGEGTTIEIYLPRHHGEQPAVDEAAEAETPARAKPNEAVLVVEDEDIVRMLVLDVLDDLGYGALEARDAGAALPIVSSDARIDLLVTDVGLPGMNGRQLAERARELRPDLKVLFITGHAHAMPQSGSVKDTDVLAKPFAVEMLASKISGMISGNVP
jgi:PAS domain S-box-containing protein